MERNDIIELTITDISEEGKALGRFENFVVFVKHAIPGDGTCKSMESPKKIC